MNSYYKDLLLKFDEAGSYETPVNFNYVELRDETLILKQELEQEFKADIIYDNRVQDASFHCDLILPGTLIKNPEKNFKYAIRISNFGNLATLTFQESKFIESIDKLIKTIENSGFIYIPNKELDEKYDGSFEGFTNNLRARDWPSWWMRYFDYL